MPIRAASCCLLAAFFSTQSLAGPLAPPAGPVTETGRFGPRTEINAQNTPGNASSTFLITQPGSYYLTGNLTGEAGKNGIRVAAVGVTIDLNGFALLGVPGSLNGIDSSNEVRVFNGTVRNWGEDGIDAFSASGAMEFRQITATFNGGTGIQAGSGAIVESCTVRGNGQSGIVTGNSSVIRGCTARDNASVGILANFGSVIAGNSSYSNDSHGIEAVTGDCVIVNNNVHANVGNGIIVDSDCLVRDNNCSVNGFTSGNGAGILVTGSDNRIESNNVTDNDRGIDVNATVNFIVRNSASGNGVNFDIVNGNAVGQRFDFSGGGDIVHFNNGPGEWSNFEY